MLIQERRLEYKNKAVMGGLEKFAPNWVAEAQQEATTDAERQLIEEVSQDLYRYPDIPEADRPNFIHRILVRLHKSDNSAAKAKPESKPTADKKTPAPPPAEASEEAAPTPKPAPAPAPEPAPTPTPTPTPEPAQALAAESIQETKLAPKKPAPPPPSSPRGETRSEFAQTGLNSSVTKLPGIKEAMAKKLAKLGVHTVGDFLNLYPRRYDDYRSLKPINRLQYGEEDEKEQTRSASAVDALCNLSFQLRCLGAFSDHPDDQGRQEDCSGQHGDSFEDLFCAAVETPG